MQSVPPSNSCGIFAGGGQDLNSAVSREANLARDQDLLVQSGQSLRRGNSSETVEPPGLSFSSHFHILDAVDKLDIGPGSRQPNAAS